MAFPVITTIEDALDKLVYRYKDDMRRSLFWSHDGEWPRITLAYFHGHYGEESSREEFELDLGCASELIDKLFVKNILFKDKETSEYQVTEKGSEYYWTFK